MVAFDFFSNKKATADLFSLSQQIFNICILNDPLSLNYSSINCTIKGLLSLSRSCRNDDWAKSTSNSLLSLILFMFLYKSCVFVFIQGISREEGVLGFFINIF